MQLDYGLTIADANYTATDGPETQHVVIVLQRIDARPKAIGKQLRMFADDVN